MRALRVEGVPVLPGRRRLPVPAVRSVGARGELPGPEAHPVPALHLLPEAHPEIRARAVAGGGAPQHGRELRGWGRLERRSGQVLGERQDAVPVPLRASPFPFVLVFFFFDNPFLVFFHRGFSGEKLGGGE